MDRTIELLKNQMHFWKDIFYYQVVNTQKIYTMCKIN